MMDLLNTAKRNSFKLFAIALIGVSASLISFFHYHAVDGQLYALHHQFAQELAVSLEADTRCVDSIGTMNQSQSWQLMGLKLPYQGVYQHKRITIHQPEVQMQEQNVILIKVLVGLSDRRQVSHLRPWRFLLSQTSGKCTVIH